MGYILTTSTEQDILETIRFVAMVRGSHEVVVAQSTREILELARRNKPSLAVWDLGLNNPVQTQDLRQWYGDSMLQPVPLVLMAPAGQSSRQSLPSPLPHGTTCLVKPVDLVELGLRVGVLLDPGNGSPSSCNDSAAQPADGHRRRVGDVVLDYQLFQVTVNDEATSLTPTEFKLLRHLMEHLGQTFSSEQLLKEVWKYPPGAGSPDVVRMYVKRLRDKLEPDPQEPQYIVTISGHGYQMPIPETTGKPSDSLPPAQRSSGNGIVRRYREAAVSMMAGDDPLQEVLLALQTVTLTCQATLGTMARLVDELSGQGAGEQGSSGARELGNAEEFIPARLHPCALAPPHPCTNESNTPADEIAAAAQSLNGLAAELQATLTQLRAGFRPRGAPVPAGWSEADAPPFFGRDTPRAP